MLVAPAADPFGGEILDLNRADSGRMAASMTYFALRLVPGPDSALERVEVLARGVRYRVGAALNGSALNEALSLAR